MTARRSAPTTAARECNRLVRAAVKGSVGTPQAVLLYQTMLHGGKTKLKRGVRCPRIAGLIDAVPVVGSDANTPENPMQPSSSSWLSLMMAVWVVTICAARVAKGHQRVLERTHLSVCQCNVRAHTHTHTHTHRLAGCSPIKLERKTAFVCAVWSRMAAVRIDTWMCGCRARRKVCARGEQCVWQRLRCGGRPYKTRERAATLREAAARLRTPAHATV